jgi:hypothetical protein
VSQVCVAVAFTLSLNDAVTGKLSDECHISGPVQSCWTLSQNCRPSATKRRLPLSPYDMAARFQSLGLSDGRSCPPELVMNILADDTREAVVILPADSFGGATRMTSGLGTKRTVAFLYCLFALELSLLKIARLSSRFQTVHAADAQTADDVLVRSRIYILSRVLVVSNDLLTGTVSALWRTLRCGPLCSSVYITQGDELPHVSAGFLYQTSRPPCALASPELPRCLCGILESQPRFATLLTGEPAAGHVAQLLWLAVIVDAICTCASTLRNRDMAEMC